jgi:hypothetical protein
MLASLQILNDSAVDIVALLASAAAESIVRQISGAASTALYGAATAGQEVTLTTLTNAKIAGLAAKLDPAYWNGAKLYCSPTDYSLLLADDPVKLAAYPFPIVVTNAATNFVAASVTGPVLANMGRTLTMRRVRSQSMVTQVLRERWADSLQVGITVFGRFDFAARGETTAAVWSH